MRDIIMPSTVGKACAVLRDRFATSGQAYTSGFTVQPELPPASQRTARMLTVADNSGPDDGVQTRRRHGFNLWAESSVIAEKAALYAMACMRSCADGDPITLVDQLFGPVKVTDDTKIVVGDVQLSQYFFTCRITARGSDF